MFRCGLLGSNIQYSLSPKIHQVSSALLGIPATYDLIDLNPLTPDKEITKILGSYNCLNITTPFKKRAEIWCQTDAVCPNTLWRDPASDIWLGTTTDHLGFANALQQLEWAAHQDLCTVIIGSGGVVPAVLRALQKMQINHNTFISSRQSTHYPNTSWMPFGTFPDQAKQLLLIQATPLTHTQPSHLSPYFELLEKAESGVIMDLTYGKKSILLGHAFQLNQTAGKDFRTQNGIPMLIRQAKQSQEIWWQASASYDSILQALGSPQVET